MTTADDIRQLVDPQGYIDSLGQAKAILLNNLTRALVDYDLTEASPKVEPETKARQLSGLLDTMRDIKWRMEEIDRRIEDARNGAMGRPPNRAERRRKK